MEFDDYVRLRGQAFVRLARLLVGDRYLGEDLAQEVLATAFVRWKRIAATDAPDAYLRRMLVNAAISRKRRKTLPTVTIGPSNDLVDRRDLGAMTAERDAMWRVVRTLPAKQRTAVVLRFYEDMDDAAIAELLGCRAVTVRTQIMRALQTLRTRMADIARIDGDVETLAQFGSTP